MLKIKRPRIRLLHSESELNKPPIPTPIDDEIARNNGTSVAIEATRESLEASKISTTPSLSEIIEHKTRENGRLREELAYLQAKLGLDMFLLERTQNAKDTLEAVMVEYQRLLAVIKREHGITN
ncbi:hypothetical protein BDZ45DRAFT_691882 [Acephala macrosclerotiorum]|nr:hypothetical protein BDZ45DRAFT_691882 [Acephala macrosclerotiorum]